MSVYDNIKNRITGRSADSEVISIMDNGLERYLKKSDDSNMGYYEASPYLNKAIRKRAEKIAEVQWYITDSKGEETWEDEWLHLLNNPNTYHSGSQFWRLHQIYKDLKGGSYIWVENHNKKVPDGLHFLDPDKTKPVFQTNGKLKKLVGYESNGKKYELGEVIYDYNPSPKDPTKGEPIINEGGRKVLKTEKYVNEYQSRVISEGGTANKIISLASKATKDRQTENKEKLEESIKLSSQTGKPIFFSGEVEVKDFGIKPEELNYLQTKRALLEDIAVMTGVPASILSSYADTKYSNAEQARMNFLREYVLPEIDALTNFLNQHLLPEDKELKFIDPTPENTEEKIKIGQLAHQMGAMTVNEKRQYLSKLAEELELDDIEGGDERENGQGRLVISEE